jgi:hypothetical protein
MAYSSFTANLARASVGSDLAPTIWTYVTTDALHPAGVSAGGYFNAVANKLKIGDLVYVYSSTTPTAGLSVVLANSRNILAVPPVAGVVHLADFTAIGVVSSS